jgi:hypothetical protein
LEGAFLRGAQLQGADLRGAHLNNAVLRLASFDHHTRLAGAHLNQAMIDEAVWGGANLTVVSWGEVRQLGDERQAREAIGVDGKRKSRHTRVAEYQSAVRAYRQLATILRDQGLSEEADRYAYHTQFLRRQVLRRQRQWAQYVGSVLLDWTSGYGYRPARSFLAYVIINALFAGAYALLAHLGLTALQFSSWDSPLVLSVTSFHGRVFFAGGLPLTDWVARVGAIEAIVGLLIEITFIATFTQRFFAR